LFVTFRLQMKQVDQLLVCHILADDNSVSLRPSMLFNGSNDEQSKKIITLRNTVLLSLLLLFIACYHPAVVHSVSRGINGV